MNNPLNPLLGHDRFAGTETADIGNATNRSTLEKLAPEGL